MFSVEFYYDMCAISISQDSRSIILTLSVDNDVVRSVRDSKVKDVVYKASGFTSFYAAIKDVKVHNETSIDNAIKQQIIAFDDFCKLPN